MRLIGILLIIGIVFSYVPAIPMENCPEGNHHTGDHRAGDHHTGNTTMDCGYSFHCPILFNINMLDPMPLPLTGRLIILPPSLKVDEVPYLIFRPPKAPVANFS